MKAFITASAFVLILASAAAAQTAPWTSLSLNDDAEWLLAPEPQDAVPGTEFTLGPRAGYLKAKDADRGTWFAGVQGRMYAMEYFAVEGSITFHQDEFADGDITVTSYPVEVTGLIIPFPDLQVRPYGLAGVGWYFTRVDFSGALEGTDSETDNFYGLHVGAGAEMDMGESITLDADFRYVFISERDFDPADSEFDFWQLTLGGNFKF